MLKFGDRVMIEGAPRMFQCDVNGLTGHVLGTGTAIAFVALDCPSEALQERIRAGHPAGKLLVEVAHCVLLPAKEITLRPITVVNLGGASLEDLVPVALDEIEDECTFCPEPKAPGREYCVSCCVAIDDAENEGMVN